MVDENKNDSTCVSLLGLIKKTIGSSLLKKSESKNLWFLWENWIKNSQLFDILKTLDNRDYSL
jgi:hypothetical protein